MTAYRDLPGGGRPGVLVCAGLDPSGGAGLIADVGVARMLGTRPVGVVTALTAQATTGVVGSQPVDAGWLREQLELLLSDVEVHGVKVGLLGTELIAIAIGHALQLTGAPVVWDPVLAPSRGRPFVDETLVDRALIALGPHLTLVTPNAHELALLTHRPIDSLADAIAAGRALAERLDAAVLVKGGHLRGEDAVDVLCQRAGVEELRGPRTPHGEDVHGTGCALSTAIAAYLARGAELVEACRLAKELVADRIAAPARPGRGAPAVM